MLRILFILLAVVSAILAVILELPLLYVAAGALLLIAVFVLVVQMRRRHTRERQTYTRSALSKEEELNALGIVEIRPKERPGGPRPRPVPPAEEQAAAAEPRREGGGGQEEPVSAEASLARPEAGSRLSRGEPSGGRPPEGPLPARPADVEAPEPAAALPAASASTVTVRKREPAASGQEKAVAGGPKKEVITATLQALQLAVGANTVCLLKQEELALRYDIEAIVSRNYYARTQGHFSSQVPLLTPSRSRQRVSLLRVGEKGVSTKNLGYYMEPIAVRQVAVAVVPHPSEIASYFLLADTMEDGGLSMARQRKLLAEFAELVGSLLDMREPELGVQEEDEAEVRPRRDIIAEEMQKARVQHRPLALALIYLNRAEAKAEEGATAVLETERMLEGRLQELVGDGRIERFGELTYGVFYNEPVADVEARALQLQRALTGESGPLLGGISIGVAMLQDRHENPDMFRADATEALREAYETGACTILA